MLMVSFSRWKFQSLDWVERLSDSAFDLDDLVGVEFQSLDWVERLSDDIAIVAYQLAWLFQSLDWVERLSDLSVADGVQIDGVVSIPRLG